MMIVEAKVFSGTSKSFQNFSDPWCEIVSELLTIQAKNFNWDDRVIDYRPYIYIYIYIYI